MWLRSDKTILSSVSSAANIHDNSNLKSSILTLQDYINKSGGDYFEDGAIKVSKLSLQGGQIILETADKVTTPLKKIPLVGDVFYHVSPIEQLAHTFVEKDSKLYFTNVETGEVRIVDKADLAKNYAVNGIQTDLSKLVKNYLNNNPELVARHNPTHGMVGDLLESSLGKITNILNIPQVIAMNRYVGQDLFDRKDIKSYINPVTGDRETPINLFHSQGTIIGQSAMILYKNKHMSNEQDSLNNQINKSQIFAAVGPAVDENSWISTISGLNLGVDAVDGQTLNFRYEHDKKDFVRYLTAPQGVVDFGKGLYLVGQDIFNTIIQNSDDLNFSHHDVTNPQYLLKYLKQE